MKNMEEQMYKQDKYSQQQCKTEFSPMEPSSTLGLLPSPRGNIGSYHRIGGIGGNSSGNGGGGGGSGSSNSAGGSSSSSLHNVHHHQLPPPPPPDHRRLFNGWNYNPPEPPPLPPPPPSIGSQRSGCVSNFTPYPSSLHGVSAPHGLSHTPYGTFGSGADFLQHQFNPLNQLANHRNLSFYPDLYGHHQPSPGPSLAGRSLLTDLAMPSRFDSDPLGSYIADAGAHHSGNIAFVEPYSHS